MVERAGYNGSMANDGVSPALDNPDGGHTADRSGAGAPADLDAGRDIVRKLHRRVEELGAEVASLRGVSSAELSEARRELKEAKEALADAKNSAPAPTPVVVKPDPPPVDPDAPVNPSVVPGDTPAPVRRKSFSLRGRVGWT